MLVTMMSIEKGEKVVGRKNFRWVHEGEACRADEGTYGTVVQDSENFEVLVEWDSATAKGQVLVPTADVSVVVADSLSAAKVPIEP